MEHDLDKILRTVIIQASRAGCKPRRINPIIIINHKAKSFWGRCKWNGKKEWYDIEVTEQLLRADMESITNTIAHEVLHACEGGEGHTRQWKKNAEKMNNLYGYKIKRCTSYEEKGLECTENYKYVVKCCSCGVEVGRERRSKLITTPENFHCRCGGKVVRIK